METRAKPVQICRKITHLGCLMITKNYLQSSSEAYPFSPLKRRMFLTRAWELTQMEREYLVLTFLESLSSLERPWSQPPKSFWPATFMCTWFQRYKEWNGRRTKKYLLKLTINLEKASFYI